MTFSSNYYYQFSNMFLNLDTEEDRQNNRVESWKSL